ncbi:hypothetical protein EI94DRAFT_1805099 [Lactarius quietus]|nr:hypothetical protein EI94DRAFT_1805099 [Lactarius quietus]
MAEDEKKTSVIWSQADEATLIHQLTKEKKDGQWGDNNPKPAAWNGCMKALAGSEKRSGGTPKTVSAVKNKYQWLKKDYDIVKELRGLSGFGWDPQLCTISAEHDNLSTAKAKTAKTFQTKPFPLFNAIGDLIDGTRATGEGVFQAGRTSAFSQPPSPPRSPILDPNIDPALQLSPYDPYKLSDDESGTKEPTKEPKRPSERPPGSTFFELDKYSSDDEDITPIPKPTTSKRKRTESVGPSSNSTGTPTMASKPRRISAGQGMKDMATSLREMTTFMKTKREPKEAPPGLTPKLPDDPQERAIAILEDDGFLSDDSLIEVVKLFLANHDCARGYATLKSSHARTNFIQRQRAKAAHEAKSKEELV